MRTVACIIAVAFLLTASSSGHEGVAPSSTGRPLDGLYPGWQAQCGPHCLYAAMRLLGKEPDYEALLQRCATDHSGTTIGRLVEATQAFGFHALGVKADRDALGRLVKTSDQQLMLICHLEPDHYVLLYRNDRGALSLLDPRYQHPNNAAELYELERYSGAAVVVSKEPLRADLLSTGDSAVERAVQVGAFTVVFLCALLAGKWLARTKSPAPRRSV